MSVFPCLHYDDPRAAIDWLQSAFGFEPLEVHENDAGVIAHAELRAGEGRVMFGQTDVARFGDHRGQGWVYVALDEVDYVYESAKAAGAEIVMEPTDQEYGSRDFSARDPEGNLWSFGTYKPGE